jgi:phospholipid-translocating ATPase
VLAANCVLRDIIIQTMVFAAVFAANFFNGLNTSAWTGWVFFAVFIGDVLVWVYTVCDFVLNP